MGDQFQVFQDKMMENPLIPIGCVTTAAVLVGGFAAFKRGDKVLAQKMMRLRVAAQFSTMGIIAYATYTQTGGIKRHSAPMESTRPHKPIPDEYK